MTTYSYDDVGNLDSYLYPNGVEHQYTYNGLNRLTNLTVSKVTTLASYAYDLGPAGNRTAVTEQSGRKVSYAYDDLYRLTQEKIENDPASLNGTVGYEYDPVGNRKTRTSTVAGIPNQTFTYDTNDRLSSDTYDNNGNTTGSSGNTYDYDYENHLTELNGGGVTIIYDGDGNRVSKTVGGVTTQYLVDDRNHTGYAQVVEEIVSGFVQHVYTYGLDLISQNQPSGVSFYGYDGHGSVRLLTDATGAVTDTYEYEAFGNLLHSTGSTPNNYLYTGEQLDPNVGFYYLRARYLDAGTGRFWTMDSFEGSRFDPPSLHKYAFCNQKSLDCVDPNGNSSFLEAVETAAISSIVFELYLTYVIPRIRNLNDSFLPTGPEVRKIALAGLAGAAGGIVVGALATFYAGQFASFFGSAVIRAAGAAATQLTKEYIQWARNPSYRIELVDLAGRVGVATFGGFVFGGLVVSIQGLTGSPVGTLSLVRTVRIPDFPYFTEVIIEHTVFEDTALTVVGQATANFLTKAIVKGINENEFP